MIRIESILENDYLEQLCEALYDEMMSNSVFCSTTTLHDYGKIVGGATPSKSESKYYTEFGIPWITPKDLSENRSKFVSRGNIDITKSGYNSSSVQLLPKGSILYSSRAPIGYIAISKNEITTNQGFKSVVPNKPEYLAFLYYYLKLNYDLIQGLASGSTFLEISSSSMKSIPIPKIDENLMVQFGQHCNQIFAYQEILEDEVHRLYEIKVGLLQELLISNDE